MRTSLVASTAIAAVLLAGCERKTSRKEVPSAPAPAAAPTTPKTSAGLDGARIDQLTGAKGKAEEGGKVYRCRCRARISPSRRPT